VDVDVEVDVGSGSGCGCGSGSASTKEAEMSRFIPHWLSLYNLFIQATTRIYCDSPLIPFDSITRLKFAPPAAFLWVYRESWKSGKSRKTDGSGSKGETLKSRTHIE